MIWIVNGERGEFDSNYFNMGLLGKPWSFRPLVHSVQWWGTSKLFHKWIEATVPVYFDFGTLGIWHLRKFFPDERVGLFAYICRDWLVDACENGKDIPYTSIPPDKEEEYMAQRQMVEVKSTDYKI